MVQTRRPDDETEPAAAAPPAPHTRPPGGGQRPASRDGAAGGPPAAREDGARRPETAADEARAAQVPQAGQQIRIVVPERPQLAPNITLKGQMTESGFKEEPWLADRGGSYVQLTELLYHIAEQVDGRRTLDEIAAAVSDAAGRKVSADNIRHLLARNLIPLGIVVNGDGRALAASGGGRGALSVNMKMAMVDPGRIAPLIAVLKLLYWPPVLLTVLAAAFAAEWWLFTRHGVAGSVHDALSKPGLLLLALAIIVGAAAFHELGHAAALQYGGGRVRGMGAGLYLVYPAFYTDVSDNYRLPRWSRVRTDLGGFYFNLLFALGVMALYAVTGFEFLLIVVTLINFDIIRQSMPFVRLDGYWALADVTGVPDFFTNMGAFLRAVLPLPFWKGRRLAPLKPWVRAVFLLYLLVTIPLLILLLFATVRGVPRVLATAAASFRQLGGQLSDAWAGGDALGVAAAVVQMITLALPTLGMLFLLYTLGRSLFTRLWTWGDGSPVRRALGVLGMGAVVALVALLWLPQIPGIVPALGGRPGPFYTTSTWRPIQAGERGTIGDAVRGVPVLEPVVDRLSPPRAAATPTATPVATRTAGATPSGTRSGIEVRATGRTDLRSAPATTAATAGTLAAGQPATAIGRSPDGAWLQVQTPGGGTAWVPASAVQPQGAPDTLPVVTPPAGPDGTVAPRATGTAVPAVTRAPTAAPATTTTATAATATPAGVAPTPAGATATPSP